MFYRLLLLFFTLLFSCLSCATPSIKQSFKEGQIIAKNALIYRKLIKITPEGYYQVQNFYSSTHQKQSNMLTIKDVNKLTKIQQLDIYQLQHLIFEGNLTLWFENGQKYMSFYISHGNAEGPFNLYYSNGLPEITGQHVQGKAEGLWLYWGQEGQLEQKIYYHKGIRQWQRNTFTIKDF